MDVSGEQQIDVDHNIFKQRLNSSGDIINDMPEKESKSKVSLALPDWFNNVIFTLSFLSSWQKDSELFSIITSSQICVHKSNVLW